MNGFDPDKNRRPVQTQAPEQGLRAVLESGERILWQTQPIVGRIFVSAFAIYLFAIPWTAFSLFWESMALMPFFSWQSGAAPDAPPFWVAIVFPLFGLPFIAIGFWMLAKPFTLARAARQTTYVLTNKRAVVFTNGKTAETLSYPFETIGEAINSTKRKDGSGSLYFSSKRIVDSDGDARIQKFGFAHIANVREAEEKLRRAIADFKAVKQAEDSSSPSH